MTVEDIPLELRESLSIEQQELLIKLASKEFRMNNLYTIKDKDGKERVFKRNYAQSKVNAHKHNRSIILKSRQQGISTDKLLDNLDKCIFIPGYEAGIQSYGKNESKKLANRVKLAWDRFPDVVKSFLNISVVKMNSDEILFSNGSILKIGNFRGDTLQSLHVSELGKIAKKFPEKAKELQTGAFQAVSVNNNISIESTAEGASGLFFDMWQTAVSILKRGLKLTPLDFQPIFLSWVEDPDCSLDMEVEIPKEMAKYFAEVERRLPELELFGVTQRHLTDNQKWWYAKKYEELGFNIKQEYPTFPEEAFEQSVEGTYYASEYRNLKIRPELYDLNLLVHSSFDLGVNDTFSIGFFQIHPGNTSIASRTKIIGEYEHNGEGLPYYRDVFDALTVKYGWQHGSTYVPHDIKQQELGTGKTRWDVMRELGFKPILVRKHRLQDGIEATRKFLKECEIDSECDLIVKAVQNYRKKYDSKFNVYLDAPVHDQFSHTADMLRYLAMGIKYKPISNLYIPSRVIIKPKTKKTSFDI